MPSGVFKPYAGVSTAVLVFTKTGHGGTDQVWFYDMRADGFSLDDKRTPVPENDIPDIVARFRSLHSSPSQSASLTALPEGEPRPASPAGGGGREGVTPPVACGDSPLVEGGTPSVACGDSPLKEGARARTEQSFLVPKQEIVDNGYDLSINKYKQVEYTPVEYPPTSEIMKDIFTLEDEIQKEMRTLWADLEGKSWEEIEGKTWDELEGMLE